MAHSQKFEERMNLLREKFKSELPGQLNSIDEIWSRLRNVQWDQDKLEKMHNIAHQLAGIGGSFGYVELTKEARELDVTLRALVEERGVPDVSLKEQISQRIAKVKQAAGLSENSTALTIVGGSLKLNKKVLIVDDDVKQVGILSALCLEVGCQVFVLNSPSLLDQYLERETPDIIIMDIVFPEGQQAGIDVIKKMQSVVANKIPVIFTSSRSDLASRIKASRAGGVAYASKPIIPDELKQQLKRIANYEHSKVKILIVDDDVQVTELISSVLEKKGYVCSSCHRPAEIIHHLETFKPSLILLDINMPTIKGSELLVILGQEEKYARIPTLVISSDVSAANVALAINNGANGFIPKPVDFDLLSNSIYSLVHRRKNVESSPEFAGRSVGESIKGLVSRNQFARKVKHVISSQQQSLHYLLYGSFKHTDALSKSTSLENLDSVNEQILEVVVNGFLSHEAATVIGQFQFCALLQELPDLGIDERTVEISERLMGLQLKDVSRNFKLEPCLSVIELDSRYGSPDEAIYLAELEARKLLHGDVKNIAIQKSVASPTLTDKQLSKIVMQALENKRLHLSYQPIFDVNGNERIFEALSRLEDEDNTIILPEHFIKTIVAAGKENDFNKLIVSTCVNDIKKLHGKELQETEIIVKLKMGSYSVLSLLTWVSNCLTSANLRGHNRLIFSVTEGDLLKYYDNILTLKEGLEDIHCGLMIEQVGSPGNASLEALDKTDRLGVLYYKLHPAFTQKLVNPESANTAEKQMLQNLASKQVPIIATHVEDNAMFKKLWLLGIRYFQGYFFSKPDSELNFSFDMENTEIEMQSKYF